MSDYYLIVNHSREEYLNPETIDLSPKQGGLIHPKVSNILFYLLADTGKSEWYKSPENKDYYGRWTGQIIALIGDETSPKSYENTADKYNDITAKAFKESTYAQTYEYEKFNGHAKETQSKK